MAKEGFRIGGWTLLFGTIAIVVILVLSSMAIFGWGFLAKETANFRGEVQEIEQTKASGSFRIYSYDHFFDLCVSVQNKEQTIKALEAEIKTHPSQERVEQIHTDITANQIAREESINQYNADAQKEKTIGQFRSSNLPVEINAEQKETQCK